MTYKYTRHVALPRVQRPDVNDFVNNQVTNGQQNVLADTLKAFPELVNVQDDVSELV